MILRSLSREEKKKISGTARTTKIMCAGPTKQIKCNADLTQCRYRTRGAWSNGWEILIGLRFTLKDVSNKIGDHLTNYPRDPRQWIRLVWWGNVGRWSVTPELKAQMGHFTGKQTLQNSPMAFRLVGALHSQLREYAFELYKNIMRSNVNISLIMK